MIYAFKRIEPKTRNKRHQTQFEILFLNNSRLTFARLPLNGFLRLLRVRFL